MTFQIRLCLVAGLCAAMCLTTATEAADPKLDQYQQLTARVQKDSIGVSEADVRQLMSLGLELNRPYATSLTIKSYMARNLSPSPDMLRLAADVAMLAGDHRTAVARYKAYLRNAKPDDEASNAAATLYGLLIDFLGAADDAYDTMKSHNDAFRATAAARRFDGWYLDQAERRKDHVAAANRLVKMMEDKAPLEKERLAAWATLDWLMRDLSTAQESMFPAIDAARRIVSLIREDARRSGEYGVYAANLAYIAQAAGRDAAAQAKSFEPVIAAAEAYFKAHPSAEAVQNVWNAFVGGHPNVFTAELAGRHADMKQAWTLSAFDRLKDPDRLALIDWTRHGRQMHTAILSPEQWTELAVKHTKLFASASNLSTMSFTQSADSPDGFKRQAAFLAGVPSTHAAVINSMAAGSVDDFAASMNHLAEKESWHLMFGDFEAVVWTRMWTPFRSYTRADPKAFNVAEQNGLNYVKWGSEVVAKSPLAIFQRDMARNYITFAWRHADPEGTDRTKVIPHLQSLNWVPYTDADRKHVFTPAYDEFKRWTAEIRRRAGKDAPPADQVAQITKIEAAFNVVMAAKVTDISKAPNPLSKKAAELQVAALDGKAKEYEKRAAELYDMVRTWHEDRVPFGRAMLWTILRNQPQGVDILPLQLRALDDHLERWTSADNAWTARFVFDTVWNARSGWGAFRIPRGDQAVAQRLNGVLSKHIMAWAAKDRVESQVMDWWQWTRQGNGWANLDLNVEAIDAVVTKPTRIKPGEISTYPASGVASLMWMVQHRAPSLRAKFPIETYFDDMYLAEAAEAGRFDIAYNGRDETKRIANAVAEQFAGFDRLPFGYGGTPELYSRSDFWNWNIRILGADPAFRDKALAAAEKAYGKTRFDTFAMGRGSFSNPPDARQPEGRAAFFAQLARFVDGVSESSGRPVMPSLAPLAVIDSATLTDSELDALVAVVLRATPESWPRGLNAETLAALVHDGLLAKRRFNEMFQAAPQLWRISKETANVAFQRSMARYAQQMINGGDTASSKPASDPRLSEAASVYATLGLEIIGNDLPDDARNMLVSVQSRAMGEIGGVIPVSRADPRWPVYAAQAAYLTTRNEEAWDHYSNARDQVQNMLRDLDPNFLIWLVDQNTAVRQFDVAEELARGIIQWVESTPAAFDPEVRGALVVSYANIAVARQEYPRARAWFERIAATREFEGTRAHRVAELKIAEVDRITKQFDAASTRLERLVRDRDRLFQADAYFQFALVRYDQEEMVEARDLLSEVFARVPSHPDARILQGEINLKLRRLEEAREVPVGLSADRRMIVPGKNLRVSLEDRNLAVVQSGANIEIRAWTTAGDEEFFTLLPRGDAKTRFEGELPTVLGAPKKGDRILQLLGGDKVYYTFSPRFLQGREDRETFVPMELEVMTDSELFISSGRILTKEEMEERAMEEMIRRRLASTADLLGRIALSTRRNENEIKPGNPINMRVVDPARSVSTKPDKVRVNIAATSGDAVMGFELTETGPNTGVFEGAVPTASGQAIAYASDAEEGRDPNFAISAGDFPGWVGLADNRKPKLFSVDLNDNIDLGEMIIEADVPGRKLRDFLVQTSINGRDFTTVGAWPTAFKPWDGTMRVELARYGPGSRTPATINAFVEYLEREHLSHAGAKVTIPVAAMSGAWNQNVAGQAGRMGLGRNDWYVARMSGAFYQARSQVRTFRLNINEPAGSVRYMLAINGEVAANSATAITRSLPAGVHRVDIFIASPVGGNPTFALMCDSPEPPYMIEPPSEMFDPTKQPEIASAFKGQGATVTPGEGNGKFTIGFAPKTQGRVVRLVIADFETDAPAIQKVHLSDRSGRKLLPTKEDFTQLRRNQILEIVPGDRITVTYENPKPVTPERAIQSSFMTATFSNAELSASFIEYSNDGRGEPRPTYIPMRRFRAGDAIQVFIRDPDADVSEKQDVVEYTVRVEGSEPVRLKALETADHSGVFMGTVLPVTGTPSGTNEVQVRDGQDITLAFFDRENTDPGVPTWRTYRIEQAFPTTPEMRVFDHRTDPIPVDQRRRDTPGNAPAGGDRRVVEYIPTTRNIIAIRPEQQLAPDAAAKILVDGPLLVEVIYPTAAVSPDSSVRIYAQTRSGRELQGGATPEGGFDINVPGTIRVRQRPGDFVRPNAPAGYGEVVIRGNPYAIDALDEGRFSFVVPMEMGSTPDQTLAHEGDEDRRDPNIQRTPLMISGNDEIFIGLEYKTADDSTRWHVQRVQLTSDVFFHVMERRYQEELKALHVGEAAYFRIIHKTMDTTADKDVINVEVQTASGVRRTMPLMETFEHSGVFKGFARMTFAGDNQESEDPNILPVTYGDRVTITYVPTGGADPISHVIDIHKGSDGQVLPFTKRFQDPGIAVQTQFTIAEAYFELAKRHRALGHDSLARREIAQGKKLLEEAIRDYPDTEFRAQADYLLANLAFEFAQDAKNEELAREQYMEAIHRFSDIVASHAESSYAPKAQFKKALVLEQMGEIDQACEEYVKLSYRYPDNELVAETIARLGQYFLTKGREFDERAGTLDDPIEREKVKIQGRQMFVTSGQVFGRLSERFPNHHLAGKTLVLSAQCYMRAEDFAKAVEVFRKVYENPDSDNELASEAMYWAGDCNMKRNDLINAYRTFRRLTWDYPESRWAKFARGRLTDDALLRVAEQDAAQ